MDRETKILQDLLSLFNDENVGDMADAKIVVGEHESIVALNILQEMRRTKPYKRAYKLWKEKLGKGE